MLACIVASVGCEQSFEEFDCADITDEELLAYAEAPVDYPEWRWRGWGSQYFSETCSTSPDQLLSSFAEEQPWLASYESSTSRFSTYDEVESAPRWEYRAYRCDYFDGTTLAGAPFHNTDALVELMRMQQYYWVTTHGVSGWQGRLANHPAIYSYRSQCTSTSCRVRACEVNHYAYECDDVSLNEVEAEITVDGRVTIGEPRLIRQIDGPATRAYPAGVPCIPLP